MTWKEKRIVTALSPILVVLMVAVLLALSIRYRENRTQQAENTAVTPQGAVVAKKDYAKLYIENGSFSPTFAIGEDGKWTWADEPSFPLNSETVESILALLDDPKPQQTLPMENGPENYALESPRATIIGTRGDGSTRTILLGKSTTDGKSFYAMIDGDETTVYILPGTIYQLIQTPVYDMMILPTMPDLREERLTSITIQGHQRDNAAAPALKLHTQQEGGTRWFADTEEVTDNPLLQGLLDDLSKLTITRCVDYNPSEGAIEICGLTAPVAVLTIGYLTAGDTEQELQLAIGSRVTDGSGRYAQFTGNDNTIYFLPTDMLDPLMHIAASGLSA